MGVNNRVRRRAKQRKRDAGRGAGSRGTAPRRDFGRPIGDQIHDRTDDWPVTAEVYEQVDVDLQVGARRIAALRRDPGAARSLVDDLWRRLPAAPPHVVHEVALDIAARTVGPVADGGWGPADLVELIGRSADPRYVPALTTALHEEFRRNTTRGAAWQRALAAHGADPGVHFDAVEPLTAALVVIAVLLGAPLLDADTFARAGTEADAAGADDAGPGAHPRLARVRALLAKAESTTFAEEAEALTAKAQELIARYSLEEIVERHQPGSSGSTMLTRRIWLDPPYVGAKAALVAAVASANHAQCAVSEGLGFCILVGAGHDLDAIELLVTSLLVQADRAMLAHGRRTDGYGASRTKSFRQSFLIAYADRIGERLSQAGETAAARDAATFLPVLRSHDEQVRAAFEALVPHTRGRSRSVSNYEGWVAGVAAADVAQLGARGQVGAGHE